MTDEEARAILDVVSRFVMVRDILEPGPTGIGHALRMIDNAKYQLSQAEIRLSVARSKEGGQQHG